MAFWLASPLIDPPTFVITVSELGLPFALSRAAFAVALGLLGGFRSENDRQTRCGG